MNHPAPCDQCQMRWSDESQTLMVWCPSNHHDTATNPPMKEEDSL